MKTSPIVRAFVPWIYIVTLAACSQKDELNIVNHPPIADNQEVEVLGNESVTITLTGMDPDGDEISYKVVDAPQAGTLTGEAPLLVYTPTEDLNANDQLTFLVNDGELDSEIATVSIIVHQANATPQGGDDQYETIAGCSLVVPADSGILSNDTDEDGDALQLSLVTEPEHGTLELDEDGGFTYTPSLPLVSSDTFTYTVSDGTTEASPTTVTILIDNDGIVVTTLEDELLPNGECSLREAIEAANNDTEVDACTKGDGADRILFGLAEASYKLGLEGTSEDGNETGDLDLKGEVTIIGCGPTKTIIDGNATDRVFHIHSDVTAVLQEIAITNGLATHEHGGGIFNSGTLTLEGTTLSANAAVGAVGSNGGTSGGGGGGGGGGGLGGAIYNAQDALLSIHPATSACILDGNTATGGKGGNGHANGGVGTGRGGDGGGINGGAGSQDNGEAGGFASGGGGGGGTWSGTTFGGTGGFAGGGGGAGARTGGNSGQDGAESVFAGGLGGRGGCSAAPGGGGGAGLGGAIFNNHGSAIVSTCILSNNAAIGGPRGSNAYCGSQPHAGMGYGGAIFNYGGVIEETELTYTENLADEATDLHEYTPEQNDG